MSRKQPHHTGRDTSDIWLTPSFVIDALGGAESFDLDPATPPLQPWPTARERYTEADDGLANPWFGRIWLNPPYSRPLYSRFMERMAEHDHGVALIFARTETRDFFGSVWERAAGLLFLRGRLFFHHPQFTDPTLCAQAPHDWQLLKPGSKSKVCVCTRCGVSDTNSGAPSVLAAYGIEDAERLASSSLLGQFVPLRLPRFVLGALIESTWRDTVLSWVRQQRGPVRLDELYRAFARHPKASNNPNYRAKIRQVLQHGPFERLERGVWKAA